jgi:Cu/Ag efflux protein CusF
MIKKAILVAGLALSPVLAFAAQDVASAVDGTVKKIDAGTKTVVVKTEDGTEHTFHYTDDVVVHGAKDTATAADDSWHGLKEGSKVAVHYTADGGKETAHEFDNIGDDGLKATKGTITHIDRGAKTVAVKTADGTEETFKLSGHAAADTGKDIGEGTDKAAKVTVYYTEKAGKKTAHFIARAF